MKNNPFQPSENQFTKRLTLYIMKTSSLKNLFPVKAFICIGLIVASACQPDEVSPVSPIQSKTVANMQGDTAFSSKFANKGCIQVINFTIPMRNYRSDPLRIGACTPSEGDTCYPPYQSISVKCILPENIIKLPCPGPGCPEDLILRLPKYIFPNFSQFLGVNPLSKVRPLLGPALPEPMIFNPRNSLQDPEPEPMILLLRRLIRDGMLSLGDPDPEPNITDISSIAFLFPVTKNILGFQFYKKGENLTEQTFSIKKDLTLSSEMLTSMGIEGKIIKAGTYPVIYNPQNATYNALVAVR